jgi:hypothetical protein
LGGAGTGRAIRTARYRWIEWTGETLASPVQELYDHDVDPAESQNIADTPSGREAIAVIRSHHGG